MTTAADAPVGGDDAALDLTVDQLAARVGVTVRKDRKSVV